MRCKYDRAAGELTLDVEQKIVSFVSVCCVCSQGQPQSPSQPPGPAPTASRQPGRATATRQGPARQPGTRNGREVAEPQSHMTLWRHLVTWVSSSFCLTLFSPPPRPFERARTLAVYGRSDNRANSGEPPRKRTGCAHASSANFHSARFKMPNKHPRSSRMATRRTNFTSKSDIASMGGGLFTMKYLPCPLPTMRLRTARRPRRRRPRLLHQIHLSQQRKNL